MLIPVAADIQAQRPSRKRPSTMKHTEAEVQNSRKVTKLKGKYIHDGASFAGKVYMVGDAGAIKIGDASIAFRGGKYYISYEAGSFDMRESSTYDERVKKGITEWEYENSWKKEKLGNDFAHSGNYAIEEQFGKINLVLYDGDTQNAFAKIPLGSAADSSFEFYEEDFLIQFEK